MFSFAKLAEISTSRTPTIKGWLPTAKSFLFVLLAGAAMAGGLWAWTSMWAGAFASLSVFVPFLEKAIAAVVGMTFVNYWFSREINTFMLGTREARDDMVYSQRVNPTKLSKMVNHIRQEVNAYFKDHPDYRHKHVDMPMPRLLTYSKNEIEVVSYGRNAGKAGIFFSSGCFDYNHTNLDQQQLAALIEMECVEIYLNRSVPRTVANMTGTLLNTLQNFSNSEFWPMRLIGYLTGPIQMVLLVEASLNRAFKYEAAGHVAAMGRGKKLMEALDKKVCNTLEVIPTNADLKLAQNVRKRAPYNGYFKSTVGKVADFIDDNEYELDDKSGYRLVSLFDLSVREGGFWIRELFKNEPRITSLKNYLRTLVKGTFNGVEIDLTKATTAQLPEIERVQREKNRIIYNKIPQADRYDVVGPDHSGYVAPILPQNAPIPDQHYNAIFVAPALREEGQPDVAPRQRQQRRVDQPKSTHGMGLRRKAQ